jgi:hypothetical protein
VKAPAASLGTALVNETADLNVDGGVELLVDIQTLIDTRLMVTGQSGAGKSRLFRRLAERCFDHVQEIVLDPEGEFSTLREKHDFLLVGPGGEVPAEPRAAALLARRLMDLRVSAVVDLSDLKLPARREFVRVFLEALTDLPKALQHPLLVMIDEAHLFCPEKGAGEAESTAAVIDLMSRGRKRGQAGVLATQRLAKLHKDAAAEAKNLIVGGITLDVDLKRAADTLGLPATQARLWLRALASGTFYGYGPALSLRGVTTFEVGPSATTHPRAGQRHKVAAPAPPQAIAALAAELKDLRQQAAEEVRTLDAAKARIRELEREAKAGPPPPVAPAPKEVEVVKPAALKRLEAATTRLVKEEEAFGARLAADVDRAWRQFMDEQRGFLEKLEIAAGALRTGADLISQRQQVVVTEAGLLRDQVARVAGNQTTDKGEKGAGAVPGRRPGPPAASAPVVPITPAQARSIEDAGPVSPAGRKILLALWAYGGTLTREALGVVAVYRSDTGHFKNLLSELRSAGTLAPSDPSGRVVITDVGQAIAIAQPSTRWPYDAWLDKFAPAEARCLRAIAEAGTAGATRAQVAAVTGHQPDTGHFKNLLSAVRSSGVIETSKSGVMTLHPLLRQGER